MAEGRICLSPGPYRTNQTLSLIGGANSYGYVRNENLSGRLLGDRRAAPDTGM
jgi:hypothetical protein